MNIEKRFLGGFLKVFIFSLLVVSCEKDDSTNVNENVDNASFVINETPDSFIQKDGSKKVTVAVTGEWSNGNSKAVAIGYVYGTNPDLELVPEVENLIVSVNTGGTTEIKNLEQDTNYYIRGYIKNEDGTIFYGNEVSVLTVKEEIEIEEEEEQEGRSIKMTINEPKSIAIEARSMSVTMDVDTMSGEAPIAVGIEYSTKSDFSDSVILKSDIKEVTRRTYVLEPYFLNPITKYYMRPYVEYEDKQTDNGGDSVIEVTTKELHIGAHYPITTQEFLNEESSRFVVFDVDNAARTAKAILKDDIVLEEGWKSEYSIDDVTVRNPRQEELSTIKMKRDNLPTSILNVDVIWVIYSGNAQKLNNIDYWVSEEDDALKAFVYNPFTKVKTSVDKTLMTNKTRYVVEIKY